MDSRLCHRRDVANRRTTLAAGEVVVCDEASMVSTRDLARLVLLAETAGAKVVLVGDHYQPVNRSVLGTVRQRLGAHAPGAERRFGTCQAGSSRRACEERSDVLR